MQAEFFYADDGMVASSNPVWIHTAFEILTGLFDWVRLKNNVQKTVGMVFHILRVVGLQSDKFYNRRMPGVGWDYK